MARARHDAASYKQVLKRLLFPIIRPRSIPGDSDVATYSVSLNGVETPIPLRPAVDLDTHCPRGHVRNRQADAGEKHTAASHAKFDNDASPVVPSPIAA